MYGLASIGETNLLNLNLRLFRLLYRLKLHQHKTICETVRGCKKATPVTTMVAEGKERHQGLLRLASRPGGQQPGQGPCDGKRW